RSSAGKSSAPTTRVVAPAAARSAARWSTGRRTRTPRAAARASVWAARSILSASTHERPTGFPCARRNVYAMAPPMQKAWTRARPGDQTLHRLADAVGRELDRDAERTAQVVGDGTERQLRRRPALRAAQVRGDDRQAAVLEDVADRR